MRAKCEVSSFCHSSDNRGWRHGVVVSGDGLINEVNHHWTQLVLGWVTISGQLNHLGM